MTLDAASRDPDGFIAGNPPPLILDEVQRAPDVLRAIKLAVDQTRRARQKTKRDREKPIFAPESS